MLLVVIKSVNVFFCQSVDGEDQVLDNRQLLKRLQEVSNKFDEKNAEYRMKMAQKMGTKQVSH